MKTIQMKVRSYWEQQQSVLLKEEGNQAHYVLALLRQISVRSSLVNVSILDTASLYDHGSLLGESLLDHSLAQYSESDSIKSFMIRIIVPELWLAACNSSNEH